MRRGIHRTFDGVDVEGSRRPVFVVDAGTFHLDDLLVYANGAVGVDGELTDLDGLRARLGSGRLALSPPAGALVSVHELGFWRIADVGDGLDADMLLGEVADEIDRLNGRPDSVGRCLAAVDEYLREMTEANHRALVEAFHAVPAHRRLHTGDVDRKDQPLQALVTEVGELLPDGRMLTEEMREEAVDYFRRRARAVARWESHVPADGPEEATRAPVAIGEAAFPQGWPAEPGRHVLQNEFPAPITVDGRTYRSVLHAYWTLSTPDPVWQDRIAAAYRDWDAARLAERAPHDPRWPQIRLAVMARLLRAKFTQHPEYARVLRETGDARLSYLGMESRYWNSSGTNWVGRLLELVRAELAAGER